MTRQVGRQGHGRPLRYRAIAPPGLLARPQIAGQEEAGGRTLPQQSVDGKNQMEARAGIEPTYGDLQSLALTAFRPAAGL